MFAAFPTAHFARHSAPPEYLGAVTDIDSGTTAYVSLSPNNIGAGKGTIKEGDLLIVAIGAHNSDNISQPGGWTFVRELNFFYSSEDRSFGLYYRIASDNESSTYTWQVSGAGLFSSAQASGVMIAYGRQSRTSELTIDWDESITFGTAQTYDLPSEVNDQYATIVTCWHGFKAGAGSSNPSSSMTDLADADVEFGTGGDYVRLTFYEEQVINPADVAGNPTVTVTYDVSLAAMKYSFILEGSFA